MRVRVQRREQRGVVRGPARRLGPRCEAPRQQERRDGGRAVERGGRWRRRPGAERVTGIAGRVRPVNGREGGAPPAGFLSQLRVVTQVACSF